MTAYYNEIDPFAAQWLRNLIAAGHIAPGDVDTRSIEDVHPDDLKPYTQCHFFAGIGGWSYALRLAGWPDDKPVWTGSCPCQPFSAAGQGGGFSDERHLWPHFHHLISQCRPSVVFGEQVASKDGLGWLDLVQDDLEGTGYASAAVDLCAAGIGAPHIRQRLYWVARPPHPGLQERDCIEGLSGVQGKPSEGQVPVRGSVHAVVGLVHPDGAGPQSGSSAASPPGYGDSAVTASCAPVPGPPNGHWRSADWLFCLDGKWRAVEPGTFPLAHGVPNRVGRLRGYGNAIVPQVAAEVISAYMEITK
jgi:DNA (cytosine-5)-methyltransferase 1